MPDPVPGAAGAQGADAPAFSQAQIDAINSAVSGRLTRELSPLQATIAALTAKLEAPKADPAKVVETDPVKRLQQELEETKTAHTKLVSELSAQRRQKRNDDAFAELKSTLAPVVRPELLDLAAKNLFHFERRVTAGEDGKVSFKHDEQPFGLVEGVAAWAKTPGAAVFLPPPKPGARNPTTSPRPSPGPGQEPQREDPLTKTLRDLEALGIV